jgi:1-acyl-sn-glycerol-3-phosphate acyltransferase
MTLIRSILFNIYFPIWTFSLSMFAIPLVLTPPKIAAKIGPIWAAGTLLGLRIICGTKYEVRGKENLPPEPFVIASKHESAFETALFLLLHNQPAYILKQELLKIPFYGKHLQAMAMIPIDRSGGSKTIKQMQKDVNDRLSKKHCVIIFPEGTRTKPKAKPNYQSGIAFIYKELDKNIPVVPVALNSGSFWGRNSFLKKPGTIIIEYLPPIKPGLERKEFMEKLQSAIEGKYDEIVD